MRSMNTINTTDARVDVLQAAVVAVAAALGPTQARAVHAQLLSALGPVAGAYRSESADIAAAGAASAVLQALARADAPAHHRGICRECGCGLPQLAAFGEG